MIKINLIKKKNKCLPEKYSFDFFLYMGTNLQMSQLKQKPAIYIFALTKNNVSKILLFSIK